MSTLQDYYDTSGTNDYVIYGDEWEAQVFTASASYTILSVKVRLKRTNTLGTVTVSIRAISASKPSGADLCVGTVDCSAISTASGGELVEFTFTTSYALVAGTQYAIVVRALDADASNYVNWVAATGNPYANGGESDSSDGGVVWDSISTADLRFETYGPFAPPVDKTYSKALVAIANNEFWYETSAGTMEEFTDANDDINCTNPLTACEAYQKIFIANKTNLKVADFINTKLTTGDILPANKVIPLHGTIVTGTSGASMIVDYIDATDGACNIYGYRTTTTTFPDNDPVKGTITTTDDVTFVLNAAEDAPPHWYDWTVYAGDSDTYGTMPSQPTIVCLYRGRLYLSGDSTRPHQWWLCKVENPWSVVYDSGDPLSGVSGGDADVGEIGDIHTAAIPYKDDLLVQGCVNSIWVIIGDPTAGGQLAEVSLTTGIWGAQAWCIDDMGNLYFLGNDGIYRVPLGGAMPPPENISRLNLPNLISDLDLDKSLHRVVLGYDPFNYGIMITRTLLSDGTNTGYWFDLTTQGFYPESYPASCGIFSAFYYQATDDTYKKFLLGGNDGYIREFDDSTLNDATTASTTPISSYCAILQKIAPDSEREGKLTSLTAITAGGGSGGDTDSVTWSLYRGDNAEEVLNSITSGATAFATGSWTTVGKQNKVRQRMRGTWLGIKLADNTASKTWALEKLFGNVEPAGKI